MPHDFCEDAGTSRAFRAIHLAPLVVARRARCLREPVRRLGCNLILRSHLRRHYADVAVERSRILPPSPSAEDERPITLACCREHRGE